MCFAFQKGSCKRGDACKFNHGDAAAAPVAPPPNEIDVRVAAGATAAEIMGRIDQHLDRERQVVNKLKTVSDVDFARRCPFPPPPVATAVALQVSSSSPRAIRHSVALGSAASSA